MTLVPPKDPQQELVQKSIGLPRWMWDRIEKECDATGRSRSEVVRLLLEGLLKEEPKAGRR